MTTRKDIETLSIILKAIDHVEKQAEQGNVTHATQLDSLYSALKSQAKAVVEIELLESVELTKAN